MIEVAKGVISLAEAAALVPPFRSGKPTHVNTLFRWAKHGVRGVRLETAKFGGRTVTSKEALQTFVEQLSASRSDAQPIVGVAPSAATRAVATSSVSTRRRAAEKADRDLAALGL